jgi:hypothetical protein
MLFDCIGAIMLDDGLIMNAELGRIWKEATVTCFMQLSQQLPQSTEGKS